MWDDAERRSRVGMEACSGDSRRMGGDKEEFPVKQSASLPGGEALP